ncbi:putative lysine-specific demethylase JMJ16 isoform X1 [Senna tora]|uniref:Putative lysine-specific demethylase JMJ16 isoform X1 n=1 Tax=Senna tora TaxID=362788 RepID=A0A834WEX4_9FABA|nr:putative lysine-specific demethylase JMJ16 isoform X1 [Senna tora]
MREREAWESERSCSYEDQRNIIMESKNRRNYARTENVGNLSAPPGFKSLTSFMLKRVQKAEEVDKSEHEPMCTETISEMNDIAECKSILKHHRPWILFNQSNRDPEKSDTVHLPKDLPLKACRPKGVTFGCPDCSDCLKVTARWHPEDARRDILDEAGIFHPTEEEFKDTLKYITSIHSKVEPYGICRIIPPADWKPLCRLVEKDIWERSKFVTQIQRIDGLQVQCQQEITANAFENLNINSRRDLRVTLGSQPGHDIINFESKPGPTFSLSTFKKFADDFKALYFNLDDKIMDSGKKWESSVENIEGEYGRIVQNPTEEIEVLYGKNLEVGGLSSGFPTMSDPLESLHYEKYVKCGWNLNNMLTLPGSLLSFESSEISRKFSPQIHVGMCFSSSNWKVEENQFYSLYYMHMGEPRVWYSIPRRFAADFEAVRKKYLPVLFADQSNLHDNLGKQLSYTILKSEGIPVYRCVQYPREFVLIPSGAYHSGFDCGFNCSEAVSFAPLDWLFDGQNVVEIYSEQRRKTSISYDKILLGAARKAVRSQFEIEFCRLSTPDNISWKEACGRSGLLKKAFDLRIKSESLKREFLCTSLKSERMDKDYDHATCKRECCICLRDLHLSAVGCPCSMNKFACLNHAKQLCSCAWSDKLILCQYEISELNTLSLALEGQLKAILKWAKDDLGLTLYSVASKRWKQTPPGNVGGSTSISTSVAKAAILNAVKRKRDAVGSKGTTGINDISSATEAKLKTPLPQSSELKAKQKTVGHHSAAACINRGMNSASGIKPGKKARAVRSEIPNSVQNDPKPKVSSVKGPSSTSRFMAFLSENICDVSSDSSSSSSESDDDT